MIIYATSVILSACLLFLVQPLIAKIIFPWFGGTSSVWSAALVFFQLTLLCGYAYAHWLTTCVRPGRQWLVHAALLIAACALLPILPASHWRPTDGSDPTIRILLLLTTTVGLPSLLLSAASPLLQVWYLRRNAHTTPYWLFAWSNAGSLAALLSFPLLLEPAFEAHTLAISWSVAFAAFAALCIGVGWMSRAEAHNRTSVAQPTGGTAPRKVQMLLWVVFPACASALLVATSAQLSTNIAPVPLLWVAPLALYLLTFILNFSSRRWYRRDYFFPLVAAALGCMVWLYTNSDAYQSLQYVVPLYLACLFVMCMACHGELVYYAPSPRFLTHFYVLVALGGALGGIFVGVVAPSIFDTWLELPLLLILLAVLMLAVQWNRGSSSGLLRLVRCAMIAGVTMLSLTLLGNEKRIRDENILVSRNFYGVLRVRDYGEPQARRSLINGTISHGYQFTSPAHRYIAGSYFAASSEMGRTLEALQTRGPVRFGVIGLGVGVLTSYARHGDYARVYEINPDVVDIARHYFSFLSSADARGADVKVLTGDARLSLERQTPQHFDMLAVDAFSSDAIPVHLLTNEAVELYFRHLQPDGVLAVHISNRYLDLTPVCQRAAQHVGRSAVLVRSPADDMSNASDWVLITSNQALLSSPFFTGADMQPLVPFLSFRGWTDQYTSLWPVLSLGHRALGAPP